MSLIVPAVWVSGNNIGAEGIRHLMVGFAAAGLSQVTSLNLAGKSGFLLSWVGQGAALWDPRMEVMQKLCGVRMGGWLRCWEGGFGFLALIVPCCLGFRQRYWS